MRHIKYVIVDHSVIYITNRNDNVTSVFDFVPVKIQIVLYFGKQNARKFLLKNVISGFLKIGINRQIQVISGFGICALYGFYYFSDVINIKLLTSLFSLKLGIQCLFKTSFTDGVCFAVSFLICVT